MGKHKKAVFSGTDPELDTPNTRYRIIFHLPNVGWVRAWDGNSWFEAQKNARDLRAYDRRIIMNAAGTIVAEYASEVNPRPIG